MYPPSAPPQADYYVIESTYGDRLHEENDPELQLEKIVNKTLEKGGTVVIPAFAVGRAQAILYYLHQLIAKNKIPSTPIFIDSPMATDATMLFLQHAELHQLTKEQATEVCRTAHYVHKVDESIELDQMKEPSIIISASGMATGGRILHHIKNLAPNPNNAIVFCGFQAGGTRGDDMLQGVKQIKMFGHMVSINASIYQLTNTSAHADYSDMLNWLEKITITPKKVFITHGENQASRALKEKITERYGWKCDIPKYQYAEVLK